MNVNNKNKILNILLVALVVIASIVFINNYDFSFKTLTTDSGFDSDFGGGGSSSSSSSDTGGSSNSSHGNHSDRGPKKYTTELTISHFKSFMFMQLFMFIGFQCLPLMVMDKENNKKIIGRKKVKKNRTGLTMILAKLGIRAILYSIVYYLFFVMQLESNEIVIDFTIVTSCFFLAEFALIPITFMIYPIIREKKEIKLYMKKDISKKEIEKYGITKSLEELKKEVYQSYLEIQIAWSTNDIDKARHLLSDEIYNTYKMQIETMINKGQRNVMSNFKYVRATINNIDKKDNEIIIQTNLNVECKDYIIDNSSGVPVRGNPNRINDYYYSLTFVLGNTDSIVKCPSCGSNLIEYGTSIKCEYCGSVIERESDELVLIDKKMIKQGIKK